MKKKKKKMAYLGGRKSDENWRCRAIIAETEKKMIEKVKENRKRKFLGIVEREKEGELGAREMVDLAS